MDRSSLESRGFPGQGSDRPAFLGAEASGYTNKVTVIVTISTACRLSFYGFGFEASGARLERSRNIGRRETSPFLNIRNPRNSTPAKALMPKTYIGSLHPELDV